MYQVIRKGKASRKILITIGTEYTERITNCELRINVKKVNAKISPQLRNP